MHTGYACNNRCVFCAQGALRASEEPPSGANILGALGGMDRPVVFAGGEPTLRQGLVDWIRVARRAGEGPVVLQTNGRRLAYRAYTASLAEAGASAVDVSLHGPTAQIHDHHTQTPGSFQQTVAGIGAARAAGLEVGISAVITRSNFRHLSQLVRRCVRLGVTRLRLAPARACGEAAALLPRVVPRLALARPHLQAAGEVAASSGARLMVAGVPPCLLRDEPRGRLLPGLVVSSGEPRDPLPGACGGCALAQSCAGVDPGYLARYGDHELSPLRSDQARRGDRGAGRPDDLFVGLGRVEGGGEHG